jgi:hypothetical protein
MMELRWGRVGYLASLIFPIFEHVHDIIDLPKPIRHASGHCRGNRPRILKREPPSVASSILQRLAPAGRAHLIRMRFLVGTGTDPAVSCGRNGCVAGKHAGSLRPAGR